MESLMTKFRHSYLLHLVVPVKPRPAFKSMEWFKRKGTTSKIDPSKQFLTEEKLTFQRRISSIIQEHDMTNNEGTYSESRSNTLATCFPWEIHFQSKRYKNSVY